MRIWIACNGVSEQTWLRWVANVSGWLVQCKVRRVSITGGGTARLAEFDYDFDDLSIGQPSQPEAFDTPLVFQGWLANAVAGVRITDRTLARADRSAIVAALEASSTQALRRATGEFSLAAWDKTAQELVIANDIYATCPVYYWSGSDGQFFAASDLRVLFLAEPVPFEINYDVCKRYISFAFMLGENEVAENTFFKAISKLPPASILHITQGRLRRSQYWGIADLISDTLLDSNIVERFRCEIQQAVADRLHLGRSAIALSGGLDSATVLAAAITQGLQNQLTAINLSFAAKDMPASHDLPIVKQLLQDWHIPGVVLYGDSLLRLPNVESGSDPLTFLDGPDPSATPLAREAIAAVMHNIGATQILTGEGGDPTTGGEVMVVDSLLHQRKFHEALHLVWNWSGQRPQSALKLGLKYGLIPFIPFQRTELYYWINWRNDEIDVPHFLKPQHRQRELSWMHTYRSQYAQSQPFRMWGHRFTYDFLWPRARYFDAINIPFQHLHPFLDRRMLEFTFRVPPEEHCNVLVGRDNFYRGTKLLPRRAFDAIFPSYIKQRETKTSYALMARKCLLNARKQLLQLFSTERPAILGELGVLDQRCFRDHLIASLIRAEDPNNDLGEIYQYTRGIIDLEIWLRELQMPRARVLERTQPQRPRLLADVEEVNHVRHL